MWHVEKIYAKKGAVGVCNAYARGPGAAKSKKVTTAPSETQNTIREEYTQGASFRSVLGGMQGSFSEN